jgi:hypothetical protein
MMMMMMMMMMMTTTMMMIRMMMMMMVMAGRRQASLHRDGAVRGRPRPQATRRQGEARHRDAP